MCDDCCKQLRYAIKGNSMEPSENSCQRDIDTDESQSKTESEFEFCMAKEINNMELASENSKSDVELDENEQRTIGNQQDEEHINSAHQSDNEAENGRESREREDRPLVLEERHSLSIAETKKRRARVHSNEHLFIPKELARSELHQRTYNSSANTLDQISRNSDYCIRMLKFPVGSGRARYVAQQMQKRKMKKSQKLPLKEGNTKTELDYIKSEPNDQTTQENNAASQEFVDVLPSNMPNLEEQNGDRRQLQSDDERCIVLEEIVNASSQETETEEDGTDELIERVSKRQLKEDVQLDIKTDDQLNPFFRWHDPNCSDQDIKMGLMDDLAHYRHDGFQVDFSGDNEPQQQQQQPELAQEEEAERKELFANQSEEFYPDNLLPPTQQHENEQLQQIAESASTVDMSIPEQLVPQYQHLPDVQPTAATATTNSGYRALETQHADLTLSSLLMQRFSLPMPTSGILQPNSENLQQNFVAPLNMFQQWSKQFFERRVYLPPSSHDLQQQHSALRQQEQQQHQTMFSEHQLEAGQSELQQLNAQYDALKIKEAQQLNGINKTLKRLYVNRQLKERQHAEYNRMFLQKMEESKKQEESIYEQKNQLKRQLQAELNSLEQCIADKQRQLLEQKRTWHWQRQQYHLHQQQQQELAFSQQHRQQQQQHLQMQQQHQNFFRQLQAPVHPQRLQCFQDAFVHCQISQGGLHRPLPPMVAPPPPPPISDYCANSLQQHVAQSFNGCIMRRQRIIDYTAHNISPYTQQPSANGEVNYARSTATNDVRHFTLPDFSELSGRRE